MSRLLFDRNADPRQLSQDALRMLREEIPFQETAVGAAPNEISVIDLLVRTGLTPSKGEARRQIQQGGVGVNGRRLAAEEFQISREEAILGGYFLIRKGARELALVQIS